MPEPGAPLAVAVAINGREAIGEVVSLTTQFSGVAVPSEPDAGRNRAGSGPISRESKSRHFILSACERVEHVRSLSMGSPATCAIAEAPLNASATSKQAVADFIASARLGDSGDPATPAQRRSGLGQAPSLPD